MTTAGSEFRPPRDPALPGLSKAVRTVELRERLRKPLARLLKDDSITIESAAVVYFHYKPGLNCRIVYRITLTDERRLTLFGKIHPATLQMNRRRGKGWRRVAGLHMALRIPSSDQGLLPLGRLLDSRLAQDQGRWIFPEAPSSGEVHVHLERYRPGRRALIRAEKILREPGAHRRLTRWIKVYASPLSPGRLAAARSLGSSGKDGGALPPPMPAVTGVSRDRRILIQAAVSGDPLLPLLDREREKDILKRMVRALRSIHTRVTPIDIRRGPGEELADLEDCRRTLEGIDSSLGEPAEALLRELRNQIFKLPEWRFMTVHGDFSHEQVLVSGRKIRILDSDRLALGDPHIDLGGFAANCLEAAAAGRVPPSAARRWIRVAWRGYHRLAPGELHPSGLRWFTSAALLRLAGRPLRRAEPEWRKRARRILSAAGRWMLGDFDSLLPAFPADHRPRSSADFLRREVERWDAARSRSGPQPDLRFRKAWPPKRGEWLLLYRDAAASLPGGGSYLKLPGEAMSAPLPFPQDRVLEQLGKGSDSGILLGSLVDSGWPPVSCAPPTRITGLRVAGRKPEHRCLLEVRIASPDLPSGPAKVFVKFYRSRQEAVAARDRSNLLKNALSTMERELFLPFPTARLLPELRAVAVPGMEGRDFFSRLRERPDGRAAVLIGRALRSWQAVPGIPARPHTWADELAVLERWTAAAGRVFPGIASTLRMRLENLERRGRGLSAPASTLIHRDFHDKQVLLHKNRVAILDHDLAALGNPAQDAGNLSAHLILRGLQRHQDPGAFGLLRKKFIRAWMRDPPQTPPEWIELHTSSALIRLACVYLLRPGGRDLFYALLSAR